MLVLMRVLLFFIYMCIPTDVTQEVASRGMGLVYEMSPPSEREALVNLLVGTLVEGRRCTTNLTVA